MGPAAMSRSPRHRPGRVGWTCLLFCSACYVGLPDEDADPIAQSTEADGSGSTGGGPASASSNGTGESGDEPGDETAGIPGEDGVCGDGVLQPDEDCDQGAVNDDTAACKSDCTTNVCGDGARGPGEGCD